MVSTVAPIWKRRRSSYRDGKRVHNLLWLVTCDDPNDGPATAMLADGVPQPGAVFVDSGGNVAPLSGIEADPRDGSDKHFEVNVEFTTPAANEPNDNPLLQPPGFAWAYENTTENYFKDMSDPSVTNAAGKTGPFIVANSAGEAFEQLPVRDKGWLTITMTRNEVSHDAATADTYSNTVSNAAVQLDSTTYVAGVLRLLPITATKSSKVLKSGQLINYYAKTYVFRARHEGWHDMPLDVGFNELVGSVVKNTQSHRRILDANGNPVTKPWPLDGKGARKKNVTDDAAVLDFRPYKELSWSALNLNWTP